VRAHSRARADADSRRCQPVRERALLFGLFPRAFSLLCLVILTLILASCCRRSITIATRRAKVSPVASMPSRAAMVSIDTDNQCIHLGNDADDADDDDDDDGLHERARPLPARLVAAVGAGGCVRAKLHLQRDHYSAACLIPQLPDSTRSHKKNRQLRAPTHSLRSIQLGIERDISGTGFRHPNQNWGHYPVVPSRWQRQAENSTGCAPWMGWRPQHVDDDCPLDLACCVLLRDRAHDWPLCAGFGYNRPGFHRVPHRSRVIQPVFPEKKRPIVAQPAVDRRRCTTAAAALPFSPAAVD
jgi:hypothetical protein